MREDFLEQMDKMFPDGYVIVYTCQDQQIRLSLYNPHRLKQLEVYHQGLKSLAEEKP